MREDHYDPNYNEQYNECSLFHAILLLRSNHYWYFSKNSTRILILQVFEIIIVSILTSGVPRHICRKKMRVFDINDALHSMISLHSSVLEAESIAAAVSRLFPSSVVSLGSVVLVVEIEILVVVEYWVCAVFGV